MKLRCERDVLAEALSITGRAVSTRGSSIPALTGVQLRAEGNHLVLTGTDLDLTTQVTTPAVVTSEGVCVVPSKLITDIVRSLPAGAVALEADDHEVRVSAGKTQFSVRALDPAEFPKVIPSSNFSAKLPSDELSEALRQVVRAASSDDARPVLTGVLLSAEENGIRLVATDSYRLAIRDLPNAHMLQAEQSVLIPSKALGELSKLLTGKEEVQVALNEQEISFLVGDVQLSSRLIEGQFPPYRGLIPSSYPNSLRIDRDVLLEAVRRVKLLVRDATTPVRMALRSDGVELTVVSQEIGQATEDVEAKYEGEELTVAFNPTYLIDGLEAIPPGDVVIEMIDALKAATIKSDEQDSFLYLIMPVRVS